MHKITNYYKNRLIKRLTYCQDWKYSIDMYLVNKKIASQTDEKYYKKRPILKIFLNIYFFPYNLLKLIKYLRIRHEYKKNEIEMLVLSEKLKEVALSKKFEENNDWISHGNK